MQNYLSQLNEIPLYSKLLGICVGLLFIFTGTAYLYYFLPDSLVVSFLTMVAVSCVLLGVCGFLGLDTSGEYIARFSFNLSVLICLFFTIFYSISLLINGNLPNIREMIITKTEYRSDYSVYFESRLTKLDISNELGGFLPSNKIKVDQYVTADNFNDLDKNQVFNEAFSSSLMPFVRNGVTFKDIESRYLLLKSKGIEL